MAREPVVVFMNRCSAVGPGPMNIREAWRNGFHVPHEHASFSVVQARLTTLTSENGAALLRSLAELLQPPSPPLAQARGLNLGVVFSPVALDLFVSSFRRCDFTSRRTGEFGVKVGVGGRRL